MAESSRLRGWRGRGEGRPVVQERPKNSGPAADRGDHVLEAVLARLLEVAPAQTRACRSFTCRRSPTDCCRPKDYRAVTSIVSGRTRCAQPLSEPVAPRRCGQPLPEGH